MHNRCSKKKKEERDKEKRKKNRWIVEMQKYHTSGENISNNIQKPKYSVFYELIF